MLILLLVFSTRSSSTLCDVTEGTLSFIQSLTRAHFSVKDIPRKFTVPIGPVLHGHESLSFAQVFKPCQYAFKSKKTCVV